MTSHELVDEQEHARALAEEGSLGSDLRGVLAPPMAFKLVVKSSALELAVQLLFRLIFAQLGALTQARAHKGEVAQGTSPSTGSLCDSPTKPVRAGWC